MNAVAIIAPLVRIAIRYGSGALIARGYLTDADAAIFLDDEVVGLIVALLNEAWYAAAVKYGWTK